MSSLNEISSIISEPLAQFDKEYGNYLHSEVPLLQSITSFLLSRQGKHIRPMLTILSSGASLGSIPEKKIKLAVGLEMLHNSSLIHDDIVDEAQMRRGIPTVNQRWGNKIAVLSGDFFLANVMHILCSNATPNEMNIVNRTAIEMSEGELLQQQTVRESDFSIDVYRNTIFKKTASLLATCCEIGCLHDAIDPSFPSMFQQFGYHFGMAFQMRDDILDYSPNIASGKLFGNDIKEKKITLPLIRLMEQASEGDKNFVWSLLKSEVIDDIQVEQLISLMNSRGALTTTRQDIKDEVDKAIEALQPIPSSQYKDGLVALANILLD